jgi:hypothetical protein
LHNIDAPKVKPKYNNKGNSNFGKNKLTFKQYACNPSTLPLQNSYPINFLKPLANILYFFSLKCNYALSDMLLNSPLMNEKRAMKLNSRTSARRQD